MRPVCGARRSGTRAKKTLILHNDLRPRIRPLKFVPMAEQSGHFMRVERESGDGKSRHYVVHVRDPKFAVEFAPDEEAPDQVGGGLLKKISVPNSWAGNYGQYAQLVRAAQEFFRQSLLTPPAAKSETHRLKH